MKKSFAGAPNSGSAGSGQCTPPANLVIMKCTDQMSLSELLSNLRRREPDVFPKTLPRRVVIKPNLCDVASWEAGVTTDPLWLAALATELRGVRPDVQISVIESDAVSAYKTHRSCDETYDRLGYREAARELDIELINLSNSESIEISLEGISLPIRISELFLEEFYFISIANLKVHPYERMTSILKNSLGLLTDADISALHPYLSLLISHLHLLCPPDLCIVDGRIGLEGQGPIMGDPVPMNCVIFSNDALTADAAACKLMMIPVEDVPHLQQLAKMLRRRMPEVQLPAEIPARPFAFNDSGHNSILLKFANRRLHRSSELFVNRWVDRFLRFKREPLKFTAEGIPKLARRLRAQ